MRIMLPYFVDHDVEKGANPQVFGFGVGDGQDLADLSMPRTVVPTLQSSGYSFQVPRSY